MLSVIIIAKNEEKMIRICLESVRDLADEIIIADNGSTDETLDIAKKYTDEQSSRAPRTKIVKFEGQDFAGLRNKAFEKANSDWVLYVDADERVLEPLKEEILRLVS
ncbi:MAG: putative beta 1,4 glucosyltransferase [Microgenomates group bacterium Gr01-1014_93]|nr:MAG: putative beta 1,4 glucosyltransferase [Microgenomates group bacterium Gr01-1014_93]